MTEEDNGGFLQEDSGVSEEGNASPDQLSLIHI